MKKVFIAHPISGDVEGNLRKVALISRELYLDGILPVVPYYLACNSLDDNSPVEREIGMLSDKEYLLDGFIDELWLYGDRISKGMQSEIDLCIKLGIPVKSKSKDIYYEHT